MTPPIRCVSVDVEEYYHVEAAHRKLKKSDWDHWPSRVSASIDKLLELLDERGVRATFFTLGHVARRTPEVVRAIAKAGHEIASHGFHHDRLHRLNPGSFRVDLLDSKRSLEDLCGQAVVGYRAPTFSLVPHTAWAVDVLRDAGFEYDSSIFPVRHPAYGVPSGPDRPYWVRGPAGGRMLEIPPLTLRLLGRNMPVAGGGYFRLLPLTLMKLGLSQSARQQRPAVLYFHPWEFDPDFPKLPLSFTGRLRTYTGRGLALGKLRSIVSGHAGWQTMRDAIRTFKEQADARPVFDLAKARAIV
jgi:polysaccharide deacetylase family protein (PEP-CTERM system associated)